METSEEKELIDRARGGDDEALVLLLEEHGRKVRPSIQGRIPRRWQSVLSADDVLQQTYAEAFLDISSFESRSAGSFRGWLTTLARRNLHDALKGLEAEKRGGDRRRIEIADRKSSVLLLLDTLEKESRSPCSKAAREEAFLVLDGAIQRLPPAYREVIELHDIEQLGIEEVAARTGKSPGAVYMMRARAHGKLRKLMGATRKFFDSVG